MKIRAITEHDIYWAQETHRLHYEEEFVFPDFKNFDSAFVVSTDEDIPIIVGGVKPIAELIIITDKEIPIVERREALYNALTASTYMAHLSGFNQVHCAIMDPKWTRHLKRAGFRLVRGNFLVRDI